MKSLTAASFPLAMSWVKNSVSAFCGRPYPAGNHSGTIATTSAPSNSLTFVFNDEDKRSNTHDANARKAPAMPTMAPDFRFLDR